MSIELWSLYAAALLGLAHVLIATQAATARRGVKWNMSSRENAVAPLDGAAGRLDRASKNFAETFPFFAVAILVVEVSGLRSGVSALGAELYLGARLAYLPIYAAGIVGVRSAVWLVSLLGLALVALAPLL